MKRTLLALTAAALLIPSFASAQPVAPKDSGDRHASICSPSKSKPTLIKTKKPLTRSDVSRAVGKCFGWVRHNIYEVGMGDGKKVLRVKFVYMKELKRRDFRNQGWTVAKKKK